MPIELWQHTNFHPAFMNRDVLSSTPSLFFLIFEKQANWLWWDLSERWLSSVTFILMHTFISFVQKNFIWIHKPVHKCVKFYLSLTWFYKIKSFLQSCCITFYGFRKQSNTFEYHDSIFIDSLNIKKRTKENKTCVFWKKNFLPYNTEKYHEKYNKRPYMNSKNK